MKSHEAINMNAFTAYVARVIRIGAVSLASVTILPGCATLTPDLVSSGKLTVDRVNSGQARIGRVLVQKKTGDLEVFGELYRLRTGHSRIPGHLHIKVSDQHGSPLAETTSDYHRYSIKSRQASFLVTLSVRPDEAAKVEVIHHDRSDETS